MVGQVEEERVEDDAGEEAGDDDCVREEVRAGDERRVGGNGMGLAVAYSHKRKISTSVSIPRAKCPSSQTLMRHLIHEAKASGCRMGLGMATFLVLDAWPLLELVLLVDRPAAGRGR